MDDKTSQGTATGIEAAHDGRWGVWQSDTGQWWAARTRPLTAHQQSAGAVPYLRAETPDDLRQAINEEERLTTEEPGDPR
jgi:hypothetical protein